MTFKEMIQILAMVLAILVVVAVMTGAYLFDFARDCTHDGGNYSVDGQTAWCRY